MSFRTDAIQATEGIIDALGDSVTYRQSDGYVKTISASFENEYYNSEQGPGVGGYQPVFTAKDSDGPFKEGEKLIFEKVHYQIVEVDSDADGQARLLVEKVRASA